MFQISLNESKWQILHNKNIALLLTGFQKTVLSAFAPHNLTTDYLNYVV